MDTEAGAAFARAVRLQQSGKPLAAIAQYRTLLSRYPDDAHLVFALGTAQAQAGAVADCVATFTALTAAAPGWAEAWNNLASGLAALGQRDRLLVCYGQLCALQPNVAVHRYRRGALLAEMDRTAEALKDFDRAIALSPEHAMAHFGRANALLKLGRTAEGIAACRQASALRPERADIAFSLGNMLVTDGQEEEALALFDALIARDGDAVETRMVRGRILSKLGRPEAALADFARAAELAPERVDVQSKYAVALFGQDRTEEAVAAFRRALDAGGDTAEIHNGYGCALRKLGRADAALAAFDRAIAVCPQMADAYFNRSNTRGCLSSMDDLRRALQCKPDFHAARANLARLELRSGDFAQGWRDYEVRLKLPPQKTQSPPFAERSWRGETAIAGKTLLVLAEQGMGDVILFCRYVPMAAALGAKVVFAAFAPLLPLLRTLRVTGEVSLCDITKPLPPFDAFCPLLSLPLVFHTEVHSIPSATPYLFADAARQADWHSRLGARSRPRIGLAWSGRAGTDYDAARSIPLATWAPVLTLPYEFHCLQKEIGEGDRAVAAAWPRLHLHDCELGDYADTAALAAEMDLVVSVDASILHLAGALGRPLFALPRPGDWRWMQGGETTPWYPGARLFRQGGDTGGWGPVIARVAAALVERFSSVAAAEICPTGSQAASRKMKNVAPTMHKAAPA